MGLLFGKTAMSYGAGERLGRKLAKKGAGGSTGGAHLLEVLRLGQDAGPLRGEEAEQAAQSLREAAGRMRGQDRATPLKIAADAQDAADRGGDWQIR